MLFRSPAPPFPLARALLTNITFSDAVLKVDLTNKSLIQALTREAGKSCHASICSFLTFAGNADIGGIGVSLHPFKVLVELTFQSLAAFGTICSLSTLFTFHASLRHRADEYYMDPSIAVGHGDSLVYFQIMTQVAFWIYLRKMQTYYELVISPLTTRMIACATLIMLYEYLIKHKRARLQCITIHLTLLASAVSSILSLRSLRYAETANFVDLPCRQAYNSPIILIKVSSSIYLFTLVVFLVGVYYARCVMKRYGTNI